ncbi:MAG: DUF2779 domain-containing protein [Anaerolineaceae bacterium]|nr:DUF2779 domain-containing protein [Anaerolineaceae bacterium]
MPLSKSDFLKYLEAPLHLWSAKNNQINKTPSAFDLHNMKQGYEVEKLAKEYLEKFILKSSESLLFQKTFSDNQFVTRTDVLIYKPESESYDLYEIKSGTKTKTENVLDATYQLLIVNKQIKIDRIYILHLNKEYVRFSKLNLEQLFFADDITKKVHKIKTEVDLQRAKTLEIISTKTPEGIQHCYKPKNCPCPQLCHPELPDYSIYDIPRITEKKKIQLLEQGILDIKDVPDTFKLNVKQRAIVNVAKSNEEFIDREALRREFENFAYPLYFLDYETFISAIPMCDGYHPQQQMVFQYSLHKMESIDGEIIHTEHLSITKDDPSTSLVEQLREDIGDTGTVFVWYKPFEMTRNKELAMIHPDYSDFLKNLNERICDLGDIINNGFYLHPGFKGSWSIKNVLPVMVPDLSYEEMEIGKGDEAMMAWWNLVNDNMSTGEVEKTKNELLKYCKLDTWAMVKIFEGFSDKMIKE